MKMDFCKKKKIIVFLLKMEAVTNISKPPIDVLPYKRAAKQLLMISCVFIAGNCSGTRLFCLWDTSGVSDFMKT